MEVTLEGQGVIVTGAGRGIGAAMAKNLAKNGAQVMIADINGDLATEMAHEIKSDGGTAMAYAVDVRDRANVKEMIETACAHFGQLNTMFNNAGIAQVRPFLSITEKDWQDVMDVNGKGVLICMQEAAQKMIDQGNGGSIVNTASIAGKQGYEPLAHYSASKFAVVALTQAAARAFGARKIRVNAICPGVVATDMWKLIDEGFQDSGLTEKENQAFDEFAGIAVLGRASQPEDMAAVATFLSSPGSEFMTGQTVIVDGGMVFD
ncbi:glucose 1-dehydrogenase [Gymnodinialimonas sp. 2305UL16-5]|uniref:glucose 1-dehydrogenase n=1 Tax=Gymnodinialimonas mytili TaxID=3126503 RepID=UPI0030AA7BD2